MTTQRQDYRPWPLTKIEQRPHEPWVSSSGKFDGLTTNKAAFQSFTVPPRLAPEPRKYLRSVAKFEGVSTHAADYKAWQIAPFIVHQTNQRHIYEEDRDFKSTTAATYVGHQPPREPIKVQTYERPPPLKLESVTTNREAFQKWPMPPKLISPKNHLAASSGPFYGLTTYNDTFTPKSIERKVKVRSHYAMKPTKFDATSTHRADYTGEPCASPKVLDFRPRARYIPTEDDRDFLTTTKAQHDEKPLPLCKVAELMKGKEAELRKDGHMYLKVANA
ncbi:uncharacterized protein BJ171DRAFT_462580 [Polychytrium aggregatum]|uniref:uncharacterized protein n=1 Tax=Polychytrium aggregatum TaxID=110093 RepID=UPI0022FEEDE0|nr:uncharacterized protein BJ171DRAFT_462580 [Polychytrium aggregatum]KAI9199235.1 hypothetical protein BJ171DRAFT_462580 [Polychytrium aggregatum]